MTKNTTMDKRTAAFTAITISLIVLAELAGVAALIYMAWKLA